MFNMFWQEVLKGAFSVLVQFTTNCHSIENQTTDLKDSFRESLQFVTLFQWHYIWLDAVKCCFSLSFEKNLRRPWYPAAILHFLPPNLFVFEKSRFFIQWSTEPLVTPKHWVCCKLYLTSWSYYSGKLSPASMQWPL